MAKLYIFGDSFGAQHDSIKDGWAYNLGLRLDVDSMENLAWPGIANESIQYSIITKLDEITSDDYLVVITTAQQRRWFFNDSPELSNASQIANIDKILDKRQLAAVDNYFVYLSHNLANRLLLKSFVGWLHWIAHSRNLNMLIVPAFECDHNEITTYEVKGTLVEVSEKECLPPCNENWLKFMKKNNGKDPRLAHLSNENHIILAEKMYNSFTKNEVLDLENGFNKHFLR